MFLTYREKLGPNANISGVDFLTNIMLQRKQSFALISADFSMYLVQAFTNSSRDLDILQESLGN